MFLFHISYWSAEHVLPPTDDVHQRITYYSSHTNEPREPWWSALHLGAMSSRDGIKYEKAVSVQPVRTEV